MDQTVMSQQVLISRKRELCESHGREDGEGISMRPNRHEAKKLELWHARSFNKAIPCIQTHRDFDPVSGRQL